MILDYMKISDLATVPTRGSDSAAGYDLYAAISEPVYIEPHETAKIGTGLIIALHENEFGAIFARSGIATKRGLRPANAVGVIDPDQRGELIVALHNDSETTQCVSPNERIAQLVVLPFVTIDEFNEVDSMTGTSRGSGGFGSTDSADTATA